MEERRREESRERRGIERELKEVQRSWEREKEEREREERRLNEALEMRDRLIEVSVWPQLQHTLITHANYPHVNITHITTSTH